MANSAAQDKRLGHIFHFNRCLYPCRHAHLSERAPQCQRVDNGREHAHVIGRRAVHAAIRGGKTAPDITPADDH